MRQTCRAFLGQPIGQQPRRPNRIHATTTIGVQPPVHHRQQQRPPPGQRQQPVDHLHRQRRLRQTLREQHAGLGRSHLINPHLLRVIGQRAHITSSDQPHAFAATMQKRRQLLPTPHIIEHQQHATPTIQQPTQMLTNLLDTGQRRTLPAIQLDTHVQRLRRNLRLVGIFAQGHPHQATGKRRLDLLPMTHQPHQRRLPEPTRAIHPGHPNQRCPRAGKQPNQPRRQLRPIYHKPITARRQPQRSLHRRERRGRQWPSPGQALGGDLGQLRVSLDDPLDQEGKVNGGIPATQRHVLAPAQPGNVIG
jgi:hypothetical protein